MQTQWVEPNARLRNGPQPIIDPLLSIRADGVLPQRMTPEEANTHPPEAHGRQINLGNVPPDFFLLTNDTKHRDADKLNQAAAQSNASARVMLEVLTAGRGIEDEPMQVDSKALTLSSTSPDVPLEIAYQTHRLRFTVPPVPPPKIDLIS